MFEKTLTDVVTGIRASKRDTTKYISQCIAEIKTEIISKDMHVKANDDGASDLLFLVGVVSSWSLSLFWWLRVCV